MDGVTQGGVEGWKEWSGGGVTIVSLANLLIMNEANESPELRPSGSGKRSGVY